MLKKRILAVLTVKDGLVVQSIGFKKYLPVGKPEIAVDFLNRWGVDEIAINVIDASRRGRVERELLERVSEFCFVPLTYGGGIRSVEDMKELVQAGADKIMLNSLFRQSPEMVSEGARHFGNQAMVVSIDCVKTPQGYRAWDHLSRKALQESPVEHVKRAEACGAGEIFLNSVDEDGRGRGYDLELAREVAQAATVPVILCGGVGHASDIAAGLAVKNVAAAAVGNFFHYTEHSVTLAKAFLKAGGIPLRLDTYFNYAESKFDGEGRLVKKPDHALKEMLFEFHPMEKI